MPTHEHCFHVGKYADKRARIVISKKVVEPGFVHSLFRSGSTYFYNALKRETAFTPYHEPFHEVIGELTLSWDNIVGRTGKFKSVLRHEFLNGTYFDEYSNLLPYIKKTFTQDVSYATFFLDKEGECPSVKSYVDCLIIGAKSRPIFQCTRTFGRIEWLKKNYGGTHLYLLRNPWDQWFSYMVDPYITVSTQLIYSQPRLPIVLREVSEAAGFTPCGKLSLSDMTGRYMKDPVAPEVDYFLFFGLWVYAFLNGESNCDLVVDMDKLSESKGVMEGLQPRLSKLGFGGLRFDDCELHRGTFRSDEVTFYRQIEGRVLEIFRRINYLSESLPKVERYLNMRRNEVFVNDDNANPATSMALEDGVRVRRRLLLLMKDHSHQRANMHSALSGLDTKIEDLNKVISERDLRIAEFNHSIYERDTRINKFHQELAEKIHEVAKLRDCVEQVNESLIKRAANVEDLTKALAQSERSLNERDSNVAELNQAILERGAQIANLAQAVIERDSQVTGLSEALSERDATLIQCDEKIARLSEAISERDAQITGFTDTVTYHDGKIAELSKLVANHKAALIARDGEIERLNQTISELNDAISSLHQTAFENDNRLTELNKIIRSTQSQNRNLAQTLTRRDFNVVDLRRTLASRDAVIVGLRQSLNGGEILID